LVAAPDQKENSRVAHALDGLAWSVSYKDQLADETIVIWTSRESKGLDCRRLELGGYGERHGAHRRMAYRSRAGSMAGRHLALGF